MGTSFGCCNSVQYLDSSKDLELRINNDSTGPKASKFGRGNTSDRDCNRISIQKGDGEHKLMDAATLKKQLMQHFAEKYMQDQILNSTTDNTLNSTAKFSHVANFKNFRGFKKIENIKDKYKIGRVLGEGSFG